MKNTKITKIIEDKEKEIVLLKKSFLDENELAAFMQTHNLNKEDPIVQKNQEIGNEIMGLEKDVEILREAVNIIERTIAQNIEKAARSQRELLQNLAMRVSDSKINTTVDGNNISISKTTFSLNRKTGWETEKLKISYADIQDVSTYQVEEYYYDYNSASDPPFESTPAVTKINKKEALEKFFSIIEKL